MPNDLPTLRSLLQRVEKATGPDKQLDAEIVATALSKEPVTIRQSPINGAWCVYVAGANGKERLWEIPAPFRHSSNGVTASVDAARALMEKVLPGWGPAFMEWSDASVEFEIVDLNGMDTARVKAPTEPLAIVAAAVVALIAQAEKAEVVE